MTRKSPQRAREGMTEKPDPKRYCGIVFIAAGSSWYWAATPEEAALRAAKQAKSDWSSLFKFKRRQEFKVAIYDMAGRQGWYADAPGRVFDRDTQEPIPLLRVDEVVV